MSNSIKIDFLNGTLVLLIIFGIDANPIETLINDHHHHRIVNGTDANIEDFPFMVSFRIFNTHICGATLISANWILTAGHCVAEYEQFLRYFTIQYNSTIISEYSNSIVGISQMILHEAYDEHYLMNDIAILRTISPVIINRYAILLPQFSDTLPGIMGTLIGWGYEQTDGKLQTTLQQVNLNIYSDRECSNLHNYRVYPSNICAGIEGGGQGQCNGDSGGPLIVENMDIGIVSWSMKPCTIAPYPGVFTQISYYRQWIQQRTGI